jgi:C-terminal processing protease CtpA/Prc
MSARAYVLFSLLSLSLLSAFSSQARAADPTPPKRYLTLQDRRTADPAVVSISVYPPKDPAQAKADRDLVTSQTSMFLEQMYAHLQLKEQTFGVHPLDQIARLIGAENSLDESQFQLSMSKAFLDLNDLHTNYYFPKPYRCFSNTLPFSVDRVRNAKTGKLDQVAISAITTVKDILNLSPGVDQLSPGDIVSLYEGVDPLEAAKGLEELGAGANPDARIRRSVERLVLRPQKLDPLPATNAAHPDKIEVEITKADGSQVTLQFPWVSYYPDPTCLGLAADPAGFHAAKSSANEGSNDFELEFARLFPRSGFVGKRPNGSDPDMDLTNTLNTADPLLHYKVLKNKKGQTFGYLRLDSFQPTKPMNDLIDIIQGLLSKEFAATTGVVVDLRNNGGGQINFGEEMIQLFTPKEVQPENFTLRASLENLEYLKAAEASGWFDPVFEQNVLDARAQSPIPDQTKGAPLTRPETANAWGQAYFKPVAVLANSSCFSTCDMYSAGMQDHGAAEIWMEDERTGGGGANVMAQSDFLSSLPKEDHLNFIQLPNGQDFRIAWRQAVRVGKHEGELLEDNGVHADHFRDLPSSTDDLALTSQLTMQTITDSLARQAPLKFAAAYVTNAHPDFPAGAQPSFEVSQAGASSVEVYKGTKLLATESVRPSRELKPLKIEVPQGTPLGNLGKLTVAGKLLGIPEWRKVIEYRVVPAPLNLTGPTTLDLSNGTPTGMAIYTRSANAQDGWRIDSGALVLGKDGKYANNVNSDASIFVTIPSGGTHVLMLNAAVDSEKDFDFFKVSTVVDGKETVAVGPLSGHVDARDYAVDLSAAAGKTVEIRIHFDSDAGTVDKGIIVKDVSIR